MYVLVWPWPFDESSLHSAPHGCSYPAPGSLVRDESGTNFMTRGTTWADLPFHLNIISSFLYGANVDATVFRPLASVFYSNTSLAYPFLPDFHAAYNVAAGRWV